MQKLNKILKKNLLRSYIKHSFFVLIDIDMYLKNSTFSQKHYSLSKNLIKSTVSQIDLIKVLGTSSLKLPVRLDLFKTIRDLKLFFNYEKDQLKKLFLINLVKINNLFLKDSIYISLMYRNFKNQISDLNKSIYEVKNLILVLRWKLNLLGFN
jgi:hypothetical protein